MTLAMMEAAAMQAQEASPSTMVRWGTQREMAGVAIDEQELRDRTQLADGDAHSLERGVIDVEAVDGGHVYHAHAHREGLLVNQGVQALPGTFREGLGIRQPQQANPRRQDDGRGDHRPGEGTASGFIHARDQWQPFGVKGEFDFPEAAGAGSHRV